MIVADYSLMKTTILLLVSDPVVRSILEERHWSAKDIPSWLPATWGEQQIG